MSDVATAHEPPAAPTCITSRAVTSRRAPERSRSSGPSPSAGTAPTPVDIVAPDRFCAGLLVDLVGSSCPYELVGTGAGWIVRLQQQPGLAWEADLLLLVQTLARGMPVAVRHDHLRRASVPPSSGVDSERGGRFRLRRPRTRFFSGGEISTSGGFDFSGLSKWGSLT